jgi:hypothetical protein
VSYLPDGERFQNRHQLPTVHLCSYLRLGWTITRTTDQRKSHELRRQARSRSRNKNLVGVINNYYKHGKYQSNERHISDFAQIWHALSFRPMLSEYVTWQTEVSIAQTVEWTFMSAICWIFQKCSSNMFKSSFPSQFGVVEHESEIRIGRSTSVRKIFTVSTVRYSTWILSLWR